ncbi:MAG: BlaI/MecI/CopY family transcriptional regulator [Bacteroidota bacterium]
MSQPLEKLTRKEEEIMQVLWKLEKAFVNDIRDELPEPKPHRNTVSTMVRNLQTKGYVGHEAFGPTHRYYPIVTKESYSSEFLGRVMDNYFDQSYKNLVAFFAKEEKISKKDLEEIIRMIEKGDQ